MKKIFLFACVFVFAFSGLNGQSIITQKNIPGSFSIVSANKATAIYVDAADLPLVQKAAAFLQSDIEKVTGQKAAIVNTLPSSGNVIILGTAIKSSLIKNLVAQKKIKH